MFGGCLSLVTGADSSKQLRRSKRSFAAMAAFVGKVTRKSQMYWVCVLCMPCRQCRTILWLGLSSSSVCRSLCYAKRCHAGVSESLPDSA